jgi:predicted nucleic acid-binding Zn ribbon protein
VNSERGGPPRRLGDVLAGLLRRRNWVRSLERETLEQAWVRAAGEGVARRSRVLHFRDGTLTIEVSSAAQRYELEAFQAASILDRLQADDDAPPVRQLAFRLGHSNT